MKAGIIAAGRGDRLLKGGITVPKPLIPIAGEPMIARVIRAASRLKVTSIACIVNDLHPEVANYIGLNNWPVPVELTVKTTPNSMESLFALSPLLAVEPFLLFTVDAVFSFKGLQDFYAGARCMTGAQGILALTSFVDDEKPLWVRLDPHQKIVALGAGAGPTPYVTAGIYFFCPSVFDLIAEARKARLGALRQFLGFLAESGDLYGIPISKTMDVDHPEDIEKAEIYLKEIGEIV